MNSEIVKPSGMRFLSVLARGTIASTANPLGTTNQNSPDSPH